MKEIPGILTILVSVMRVSPVCISRSKLVSEVYRSTLCLRIKRLGESKYGRVYEEKRRCREASDIRRKRETFAISTGVEVDDDWGGDWGRQAGRSVDWRRSFRAVFFPSCTHAPLCFCALVTV